MPVGGGAGSTPPPAAARRAVALGSELRRLHDRIRQVLDDARDGVDPALATASLTDDLVLRCRAVCTTLGTHHRDEDSALFPWLRREHPELGAVADRLEQDHSMIGTLLAELEGAVRGGASGEVLLGHLAGVGAIMESHFRYEERELVSVLDASDGHGLVLPERFWHVDEKVEPGGGPVPDVSEQVVVTRNVDENRWEARIGGELAGFAAYQLTDELVVFTHTEVDEAFEGKGVGGALARHALDEVAREGGRKVMPLCPFIKAWIRRHPDYVPLVYGVATGTHGS